MMAHCTLKAANILVDDGLMARVYDSGLSVLRPLSRYTTKLKASEMPIYHSGYIAPEHGEVGVASTGSDVYAFGVLLLELLTGERPFDSLRPAEEQSLATWASSRLHDDSTLKDMVFLNCVAVCKRTRCKVKVVSVSDVKCGRPFTPDVFRCASVISNHGCAI